MADKKKVYAADTLTGGGEGALDAVADGALLLDQELAFVLHDTYGLIPYKLDIDSGAVADGLNVIAPFTNPGDKRWIRQRLIPWSGTGGDFHKSTMAGDETLTAVALRMIALLDPNGADRTVNCTPAGYFELTIVNTGEEGITFDPAALAATVGGGQARTFYYDGSTWH